MKLKTSMRVFGDPHTSQAHIFSVKFKEKTQKPLFVASREKVKSNMH